MATFRIGQSAITVRIAKTVHSTATVQGCSDLKYSRLISRMDRRFDDRFVRRMIVTEGEIVMPKPFIANGAPSRNEP